MNEATPLKVVEPGCLPGPVEAPGSRAVWPAAAAALLVSWIGLHYRDPPSSGLDGSSAGLDETVLVGKDHQVDPVRESEFRQDMTDVGLHAARCQAQ